MLTGTGTGSRRIENAANHVKLPRNAMAAHTESRFVEPITQTAHYSSPCANVIEPLSDISRKEFVVAVFGGEIEIPFRCRESETLLHLGSSRRISSRKYRAQLCLSTL